MGEHRLRRAPRREGMSCICPSSSLPPARFTCACAPLMSRRRRRLHARPGIIALRRATGGRPARGAIPGASLSIPDPGRFRIWHRTWTCPRVLARGSRRMGLRPLQPPCAHEVGDHRDRWWHAMQAHAPRSRLRREGLVAPASGGRARVTPAPSVQAVRLERAAIRCRVGARGPCHPPPSSAVTTIGAGTPSTSTRSPATSLRPRRVSISPFTRT